MDDEEQVDAVEAETEVPEVEAVEEEVAVPAEKAPERKSRKKKAADKEPEEEPVELQVLMLLPMGRFRPARRVRLWIVCVRNWGCLVLGRWIVVCRMRCGLGRRVTVLLLRGVWML